jgi:1,4-dihydroxy-2-naphthoate polyprenyltransferase
MSNFPAGESVSPAAARVTAAGMTRTARSWISAMGLSMTVVVLLQVAYSLAIAHHLGALSPARVLLTVALFIPESISRRLINDYDDYRRGVDRADNARPGSALALGLPMGRVRAAGLTCYVTAIALLAYLLYTTSPISVVIAPLALVTLAYTGGPSPLGHHGLGEVVDFVFTGCLVTGIVVWVNVHRMSPAVILGAMAAGFLFSATMFHNDLRDMTQDRQAGKRTLAHALPAGAAKACYAFLLAAPYLCVILIAWQFHSARYAAPLLSLPYAAYLATGVGRSRLDRTMPSWSHMPRLLSAFFALFALAAWI